MWFAVGFGAACGISVYLLNPGCMLLPVLVLSGICLLCFRKKPVFRPVGILLLGICIGMVWFLLFEWWYLKPVYSLDGVTRNTGIRCCSYTERAAFSNQVSGTIPIAGKAYPVVVYLDTELHPEPGTVLSGDFLFKVTAPGGIKESSYYQGERVFLLAYQQEELVLTETSRNWRDYPAVFRQKFLSLLENNLPDMGFSFGKALLLGDSSGLDYGVLTDLTVSGVRHIVAVSGLHVSILFGLLNYITVRKRHLMALIGIPALVLFAAVAGFTPSVCRASLMSGLMLLSTLLNREYDGPSALSFAGLVLLIVNPLVITSVSYQLSFASVAGIFAFSSPIRKGLQSICGSGKPNKLMRGILLSISVTLGATAATMPLCAIYFGTVSLAAVLTNLLVLWAVSVIFYGLLAVCIVGSFWSAAGVFLGNAVTMLIRYVLLVAEVIADFPLASVYTKSPYITAWLVFVYIVLFVFLVCKNKNYIELFSVLILGLCCALIASWTEPAWSDVRFTVLDVGQGQCILLQTEGRNYMVDCGGSSDAIAADTAAEALLSQGISKLDGLILTHYDRDHAGGIENLLSRIDTELMILPPVYSNLQLKADHILYAYVDVRLTLNKSAITIFSSGDTGSANENSLCILFDTEKCDILITGDRNFTGEQRLLQSACIGDVDVLVAGHHGAEDSTGAELLSAVQPEIVCISVGEGNIYKHPHKKLLQRLEDYGCTVYRTDLHGDILIRR